MANSGPNCVRPILAARWLAVLLVAAILVPLGRWAVATRATARRQSFARLEPYGVLHGRRTEITDAAFSPSGAMLATAGADGTVQLWDVRQKRRIRVLQRAPAVITRLRFSQDGSMLAASYGISSVLASVWNARTGKLLHDLSAGTNSTQALAFSPDGRVLLTGSADGVLRYWNLRTAKPAVISAGHTGEILSAVFSPDGRQMASASLDGTVRLWNARTGALAHTLPVDASSGGALAFSRDGATLAIGAAGGTVQLWNSATGRVERELRATGRQLSQGIRSIVYSGDGTRLGAGGDFGPVVWDVPTGTVLLAVGSEDAPFAVLSGFRQVIVRKLDILELWDIARRIRLAQVSTVHGTSEIAADPTGKFVASGGVDGTVQLWKIRR